MDSTDYVELHYVENFKFFFDIEDYTVKAHLLLILDIFL